MPFYLFILQEVDISNNNIGPQSFRSVCLAMCNNVTVSSLNLADNMADTDSAVSKVISLFSLNWPDRNGRYRQSSK